MYARATRVLRRRQKIQKKTKILPKYLYICACAYMHTYILSYVHIHRIYTCIFVLILFLCTRIGEIMIFDMT